MNEAAAAPVSPAIRQALAAHTTLTLAYADADGPGACAVLYAPTARAVPLLAFVTSTGTRHGRALQEQPSVQVAFTAQRDGQEWSELTGVQGRGTCRRLEGGDRKTAWAAYSTRFPFVTPDDTRPHARPQQEAGRACST
ncbi:pyridoxamine 5'-phosphate oxidase family protein [Streptomyces spiralis]